jgi:hypothetical protein
MKHNRTLFLALVLLLPAAAVLLAAGCSTPTPAEVAPAPSAAPPPENRFVGNAACAECHKKEFNSHRKSFHAITAHQVPDLGTIVLPQGNLFGSKCRLTKDGPSFRISVGDSPIGAETLQYGIGSGKTGITFVAMTDSTTLFEMRASYFPRIRKWYVTPGQKKLDVDEMGLDYPPDRGRRCISCHTTAISEDSIVPERKFLGVGCEACHGPGGDHIAAIRANDLAHIKMERLALYGGEKLNTLCGRCHRTPQDVMERSPSLANETQRFQAYGILMSRCFKESKDKLSCLTCHDPHANATLNMKTYEKACLTCHGHGTEHASTSIKSVAARPCPVNPRSGCIPCHMPARKILPGADRSPSAVDHFIHIPPKGSRPSPYKPL